MFTMPSSERIEAMFAALPEHYQRVAELLAEVDVPEGWHVRFDPYPGVAMTSPTGHYHRLIRPSTDETDRWYVSHPYEDSEMAENGQAAVDTIAARWTGDPYLYP